MRKIAKKFTISNYTRKYNKFGQLAVEFYPCGVGGPRCFRTLSDGWVRDCFNDYMYDDSEESYTSDKWLQFFCFVVDRGACYDAEGEPMENEDFIEFCKHEC